MYKSTPCQRSDLRLTTYMFFFGGTIIEHDQLEKKRKSVVRKHETELCPKTGLQKVPLNRNKKVCCPFSSRKKVRENPFVKILN